MRGAVTPIVADEIWHKYPQYRAVIQSAKGSPPVPPSWFDSHIEAWREAFRSFGANPKKTPCSVEALWKRQQKSGELPTINPIVDLYNELSIRFGAPFGGEDLDRYDGPPHLGFATGTEEFDTSRDGLPSVEHPDQDEVIWRDSKGVTCRRWNWRQCRRTALSEASENLWFIIDRLSPMPVEELERAGEALVLGIRQLCSDVETSTSLIEP
jgi:DNA/RNA-binding domain of Phe-tRNA-synthetase-like protein